MKRRPKLFILVLILFIVSSPAVPAQQPDFHLAFENTLTGSDGETPASLNAVTFEGGIVGQAAHFSDSIDLHYPASGEISGQQGAIEFWIKPSWNGGTGNFNWVMRYGGAGAMLVGSDGVTWRIILNQFGANGLPELGVAANIDNWVAGEWHHAVFNWSLDRLELFVDGQLLGSQVPAVAPPAIAETNFQIGANGSTGFLNGSLDGFKIYPQPLSRQQIESNFCAGFELTSIDLHADTVKLLTTWREQAVPTVITGSGEIDLPGSCINWESSNSTVASVDESGLIRALTPGHADIVASIEGLQTQLRVNVTAPLRAPEEETIDPYLATPAVDNLWEIPVVILRYLPTIDGVNVDPETTGYFGSLDTLKSQIDVYTNRVKFMLEEGSRFRGYKDASARPSIGEGAYQ